MRGPIHGQITALRETSRALQPAGPLRFLENVRTED
jgi:hypothetical protein